MVIPAHILWQAMDLYLAAAYPQGVPAEVAARSTGIRGLGADDKVPEGMFEGNVANCGCSLALRLGQPMYPHMQLVLDPVPAGGDCKGHGFLLRVDSHDLHLHAAPGSPDAAWLENVRHSNKDLGEKIEAAWAGAGLPTFKEYLRKQLEGRKRGMTTPSESRSKASGN